MPRGQRIWRSRLWARHGDTRIIIHVIAEADATRFQVVAQTRSRPPAIIGSGTEGGIRSAMIAAERLAARTSATRMSAGIPGTPPRSIGSASG